MVAPETIDELLGRLSGVKKPVKRCTRKKDLGVTFKDPAGGGGIDNAQVLCRRCHTEVVSHRDTEHKSLPEFSNEVCQQALKRAGSRCECTRTGCNHPVGK